MTNFPWQTDFQSVVPVRMCRLCGQELYARDDCWHTPEGLVCTRCISPRAAGLLPFVLAEASQ